MWWSSLWECFHWSAGEALSHSQVVEWIFGSRIQSHWPCMTLWPISMFSRILATERPAVPTSQAGGNSETSSTARLASSSSRWTLMTLRMYAASRSPRLAITWSRMASSSRPMFSMSSAVRCAIGLSGFFCITVMAVSSQRSMSQAPAAADTQVWTSTPSPGAAVVSSPVRRSRTAPSRSGSDAAEADAHPAARRHQHAGALAGVEQRRRAVGVDRRCRSR